MKINLDRGNDIFVDGDYAGIFYPPRGTANVVDKFENEKEKIESACKAQYRAPKVHTPEPTYFEREYDPDLGLES